MRMFFTTRTGMTLDGKPVGHRKPAKKKLSQQLREINDRHRQFWSKIWPERKTEPEGESHG